MPSHRDAVEESRVGLTAKHDVVIAEDLGRKAGLTISKVWSFGKGGQRLGLLIAPADSTHRIPICA